MHFYINTLPPTAPILIPPPISIPLLQVSQDLVLPPLLTYSDDVLYNWAYLVPPTHLSQASSSNPASDPLFGPLPPIPTINNLKCLTLFTSTNDEAEFYLTSARIELAGVRALALMRATMDEAFVGDDLALRRIALYLRQMAIVLAEMTRILLKVREGCDPEYFYREIRPWFKGQDSMPGARTWVFEGIEDVEGLKAPTELSGPSAGQSALIHAIDIFLGVDHFAHHLRKENRSGVATPADSPSTPEHSPTPISPSSPAPSSPPSHASFLARMQLYMPRHHRAFLRHLAANPRPLRALVEQATEPVDGSETSRNADLLEGYNEAVRALKSFRDAHLRIVALYIVGPSRRVEAGMRAATSPAMSPSASSSTSSSSSADSLFHTSSSISSSISSSTSYSQSSVSVSSVSSAPALVPNEKDVLEKGTGGTLLMPFLKSVRDRTAEAEFVDRTR
jgi:indoleamine 2,3-dioxygenase